MLEVSELRKSYGKQVALDGISFRVSRGEIVTLMGPSGCGKSTAIRCINRLIEPDSGAVLLHGQPVLEISHRELLDLRRRIGFVFQHFNLIERLNVLENTMIGLVLHGVGVGEAEDNAVNALGKVGLAGFLSRRPSELSGGQKQRVAIARALVMDPELLLLDEPTTSLDPILVREVLDVIEDLVRTRAATMVIVTHEASFARRVSDRILLMDSGRIVEEGTPSDVLMHPRSEVGRKYKRLLAVA
ncbi:MAG: amino acid ABC transporter ATP-binding protein [Firmicutes bacterium]|nr:amino acid ABC transporter ATP-binding protein [Bacillota bacterium]